LFGVADEFHQSFVPGRQGNDLGDMTADLIGATLGAMSFLVLRRIFRRE
jgi:VanZ family protein